MKKYIFLFLYILFIQQCYSLTLVNLSVQNQMTLGYLDGIQLKMIPLQHGNHVKFNYPGPFYIKVIFINQAANQYVRYFFVPKGLLVQDSLYVILTGINYITGLLYLTLNNGQTLPIQITELTNPIIDF